MDRQCLPVKSLAFADGASDKQVRQEFHFQPFGPVPLALIAAATGDVEAKAAGFEAKLLGLFGGGKHLTDFVKRPSVRRRIAPRRTP